LLSILVLIDGYSEGGVNPNNFHLADPDPLGQDDEYDENFASVDRR
jgi:hypothetical protein